MTKPKKTGLRLLATATAAALLGSTMMVSSAFAAPLAAAPAAQNEHAPAAQPQTEHAKKQAETLALVGKAVQQGKPQQATLPEPQTDEELRKKLIAELPKSARVFQISGQNTPDDLSDDHFAIPAPKAGGKGAGLIPAGLEAYYNQAPIKDVYKDVPGKNSRGDCKDAKSGECGYLIVPIDYENPEAGNMAVGYYRIPAKNGKSEGAVAFNYGGPGNSAPESLQDRSFNSFYRKLNQKYDLIAVAPRGVLPKDREGFVPPGSLPFAQCEIDNSLNKTVTPGNEKTPTVEELTADNVNRDKARGERCYTYSGGAIDGFDAKKRELFLKHLGTTEAARDLDVLRSVVGAEKLHYVGFSYGTRLGYSYMHQFPASVGRFILDGVVNPFTDHAPSDDKQRKDLSREEIAELNKGLITQYGGFQNFFESFAKWCKEKHGKNGFTCALNDPRVQPGDANDLSDQEKQKKDQSDEAFLATRQMQNILRPLLKNPVIQENKNPQHFNGYDFNIASTAILGHMYNEASREDLARLLNSFVERDTSESTMKNLHKGYNFIVSAGNSYGNSFLNTIRCADRANPASANPENGAILAKLIAESMPIRDPGKPYNEAGSLNGICDVWKNSGLLAAGRNLHSTPEILVVGNTGDASTPYANARVAAEAIGGRLLTVASDSHTAVGNTMCARDIALTYLLENKLPEVTDKANDKCAKVESFRAPVEAREPLTAAEKEIYGGVLTKKGGQDGVALMNPDKPDFERDLSGPYTNADPQVKDPQPTVTPQPEKQSSAKDEPKQLSNTGSTGQTVLIVVGALVVLAGAVFAFFGIRKRNRDKD
ncbi:MAG: alpha/beta fold hydrolase [Microbacteriaceae bacterium]|nr:alpha/beta fold hydrolase [Microbacteriaceae bacterium]